MKKKFIGLLGIIFGGFFLSLELCLTQILQSIEKTTGSYFTNIWVYAGKLPNFIAISITIILIIYCMYIYFTYKDDDNNM